jgi:hypothetical protein
MMAGTDINTAQQEAPQVPELPEKEKLENIPKKTCALEVLENLQKTEKYLTGTIAGFLVVAFLYAFNKIAGGIGAVLGVVLIAMYLKEIKGRIATLQQKYGF